MKSLTGLSALLAAAVASLVLAPSAFAASFSNSAAIQIQDEAPASPYPSTIAVSGMVGDVTEVEVTLNGLTHSYLDDVGVVLEGPGATRLLMMNAVGPGTIASGPTTGVDGIDLAFDDDAATQLQDSTVPTAGSYRPANYSGIDNFTGGGPGTTYSNPGPSSGGSATLGSIFDGSTANGSWKLYVHDFAQGDVGSVDGGWTLNLTTDGVDDVAPVTTINSGPSGTISQSSASFGFSADEPATFECKLDSQAYDTCTSQAQYSGLSEGDHTFSVRATDTALNLGAPATRSFTVDFADPPQPPPDPPAVDSVPPLVEILKVTVKRKKRSAKVEFTGSDSVTAAEALSFTCSLDGKPESPCSSPTTYKKLKPGKHTIQVRATDEAGNSAVASKGFKVKKKKRRR